MVDGVKLSDLTPRGAGEIAQKRAVEALRSLADRWQREADWASRVAFALAPGYRINVIEGDVALGECQGDSDLSADAEELCQYAQTGSAWDFEGDALAMATAAQDSLLSLIALFEPPSEESTKLPDLWTREQSTDDALAIVARAALARAALARGDDVQRAWLAALTGVSEQRMRTLIAEGVLEARKVKRGGKKRALSPITHASAQQWLRARDPSRKE